MQLLSVYFNYFLLCVEAAHLPKTNKHVINYRRIVVIRPNQITYQTPIRK